jgi:hypothetical protein
MTGNEIKNLSHCDASQKLKLLGLSTHGRKGELHDDLKKHYKA